MTWFRVDDSFSDHPKVVALADGPCRADALALWVLAGSWVGKWNLEGFISGAQVRLFGFDKRASDELVRVGLWARAEGGYRFHDWLDRNPSRKQVEAGREKTNARVTAHRKRMGNGRVTPLHGPRETVGETVGETRSETRRVTPLPTVPPIPDPDPDPGSLSGKNSAEIGEVSAVSDRARKATPPSRASKELTPSELADLEAAGDSLETPAPLPCWRLWAIWEQIAGSGPNTCGPRKQHRAALEEAWSSCEKRSPDPEGLWRRMVESYVEQRRAQGKRIDLVWLLHDFTGWADIVQRGGATQLPSAAPSDRRDLRPIPPLPEVRREPRGVPK